MAIQNCKEYGDRLEKHENKICDECQHVHNVFSKYSNYEDYIRTYIELKNALRRNKNEHM